MRITCFGEVLWDIFPEHKKIGGAPLNVALRMHSMGIKTSVITRVGNDELGNNILKHLEKEGVGIHTCQIDHVYKTGEVVVTLDENNTATYEISEPVAWDFIEFSDAISKEVEQSDALVFGSLASRNEVSRTTLLALLQKAKYKIMDVNLRPPHYSGNELLELMGKADFIKLNDEELEELCDLLQIQENDIENNIKSIANKTNTSQICVTKGGKGATLFYDNEFYHNTGYKVIVVDTVGAGDSFLATLISNLILQENPQKSLDKACLIGAMVAGSEGANPIFSQSQIDEFIKEQS